MSNIDNMRRQLRTMGATFDWEAEVVTADPDYYRWNQWFFLQFLKAGLAYRADVAGRLVPQRRDPRPRAGRGRRPPLLALRREGREARPGAVVPARSPSTPTSFSTSAACSGRSRSRPSRRTGSGGARAARSSSTTAPSDHQRAAPSCACSRPARTRCSGRRSWSSPRSTRWCAKLTAPDRRAEVEAYVAQAAIRTEIDRLSTDREKTGVALGADAINPVNGERIPIYIADYVLAGYGTGAIMAVPAHDERDYAFAVDVRPADPACRRVTRARTPTHRWTRRSSPHTGGEVLVNSGPYTGLPADEGGKAILAELEARGKGRRRSPTACTTG